MVKKIVEDFECGSFVHLFGRRFSSMVRTWFFGGLPNCQAFLALLINFVVLIVEFKNLFAHAHICVFSVNTCFDFITVCTSLVQNMVRKNRSRFPITVFLTCFFGSRIELAHTQIRTLVYTLLWAHSLDYEHNQHIHSTMRALTSLQIHTLDCEHECKLVHLIASATLRLQLQVPAQDSGYIYKRTNLIMTFNTCSWVPV